MATNVLEILVLMHSLLELLHMRYFVILDCCNLFSFLAYKKWQSVSMDFVVDLPLTQCLPMQHNEKVVFYNLKNFLLCVHLLAIYEGYFYIAN